MIRIGVLALQGDFAEHVAVFSRLGVGAREVRLPEQLDGLNGLIVPGGETTTFTRLMAEYGLLEPIRRLAEDGMPIWGTCAGMIVLARQAADLDRPGLSLMDVVVERNAFGRQVDSFEAELTIPALGQDPFPAVFIRAPIIREVGPEVEVLARLPDSAAGRAYGSSPDGAAVVAARQGHVLATAFHPELTDDTRLHRYFLGLVEARSSSLPPGAGARLMESAGQRLPSALP
jgi:5'-phosphate synthase pdxT subunit